MPKQHSLENQKNTVRVSKGQEFTLILPFNATTGQSKKLVMFEYTEIEFVSSKNIAPDKESIGGAWTEEVTFRSLKEGLSKIEIKFRRGHDERSSADYNISVETQ